MSASDRYGHGVAIGLPISRTCRERPVKRETI